MENHYLLYIDDDEYVDQLIKFDFVPIFSSSKDRF